jgi:fructose-bisphosphate aldolase class II
MLREASNYGVCKVNIDSDLRLAMTGVIRKEFSENPGNFDPRKYLNPARDAIYGMVKHKIIDVLGSDNKL